MWHSFEDTHDLDISLGSYICSALYVCLYFWYVKHNRTKY